MREAEQIVSMCSACHVAARPAGQEVVDLEWQQLHLCPAFCKMACRASGGGLRPVSSFCCCTHTLTIITAALRKKAPSVD